MGLGGNCADGDGGDKGPPTLVRPRGKRKFEAEREGDDVRVVVDLEHDDDDAGGKGAAGSHFAGHTTAGTQPPHHRAAAALIVDLDGQPERVESARPEKRPRAHDNVDGDFVVCRAGSNFVTVDAVERVVDQRWINDLAVNTYLALLARNPSPHRVKILSSHFFARLSPEEEDKTLSGAINYDAVKHWIKDDLLEFDSVFFPICLNKHWILGVVNFQRQRVEIFDSMRRREGSGKVAEHIHKTLCKLIAEIVGHPLPKVVVSLCNNLERPWIPQQDNDDDCGVFMLEVARHLYSGANFDNQGDASVHRLRALMGIARQRIAAQLLGGMVSIV